MPTNRAHSSGVVSINFHLEDNLSDVNLSGNNQQLIFPALLAHSWWCDSPLAKLTESVTGKSQADTQLECLLLTFLPWVFHSCVNERDHHSTIRVRVISGMVRLTRYSNIWAWYRDCVTLSHNVLFVAHKNNFTLH